jgi:hypothetical protein
MVVLVLDVPPEVKLGQGVGLAAAIVVIFYAFLVASHNYFGWPTHHPLHQKPTVVERVVERERVVEVERQQRTLAGGPPKPALEVFDGDCVVVELTNNGAGDRFIGTGQIVSASWDHKRKHPFSLSWENIGRQQEVRPGQPGRVKLADRQIANYRQMLRIFGDHGVFAHWTIGGMGFEDMPVTVVLKVTFSADSNPNVQIIRHYQLEATPGDSHIRVTPWVPL